MFACAAFDSLIGQPKPTQCWYAQLILPTQETLATTVNDARYDLGGLNLFVKYSLNPQNLYQPIGTFVPYEPVPEQWIGTGKHMILVPMSWFRTGGTELLVRDR